MPPNVIVRLRYYDKNAAKRSFYDGTQKDDYLGYVDKGIQSGEKIDYVDYMGDNEKSSGIFGKYGLLSKEDKKVLREKLRSTESCIWDAVISFTEKFGEKNLFNYGQAQALIEKTFPRFLKQAGMNPDNITWYAGLHTNTDNWHIHLSFFENESQRFNQQSKSLVYRFGKINMAAVNAFKVEIEKHFLSPVEGIKRVRKQLVDEARMTINQPYSGYSKAVKSLVKKLYGQIPYDGTIAYGSKNTASCRDTVDSITTCILKNVLSGENYRALSSRLSVKDGEIRNICESHKIGNPEKYLLADKFQADLYR